MNIVLIEWYRDRIDAEWARAGGGSPRHVHRALEFWRQSEVTARR